MKILILLVAITLPFTAHADEYGPDAVQFQKQINEAAQVCSYGECEPGVFISQEIYSDGQKTTLKPTEIGAFKRIANKQAYVWMDTVLEGPYISDGKTVLHSVVALFKNRHLIGYRISYSQNAWNIETCEYDSENEDSLKDCDQGSISESSWVSPALTTYFRDEDAIADFSD